MKVKFFPITLSFQSYFVLWGWGFLKMKYSIYLFSCMLLINLYIHIGGGGLAAKSCLTLAAPWTVACQAPLSIGFSRQEYWSGLPLLSLI